MGALRDYLQGLAGTRATGEAVEETSYYGQLETSWANRRYEEITKLRRWASPCGRR